MATFHPRLPRELGGHVLDFVTALAENLTQNPKRKNSMFLETLTLNGASLVPVLEGLQHVLPPPRWIVSL